MDYERPNITIVEASTDLLSASELGPGATDIGAPNVSNECKSLWDDEETQYNNKEEQSYEDWI